MPPGHGSGAFECAPLAQKAFCQSGLPFVWSSLAPAFLFGSERNQFAAENAKSTQRAMAIVEKMQELSLKEPEACDVPFSLPACVFACFRACVHACLLACFIVAFLYACLFCLPLNVFLFFACFASLRFCFCFALFLLACLLHCASLLAVGTQFLCPFPGLGSPVNQPKGG